VRVLKVAPSHSVVELDLQEGRNREVRRMFEALGLRVVHLRRVQIGPIRLGELPVGKWRMLAPAEVRALLRPRP
jgi:23S rRNA pseudouridine2605 synthase